MCYHVIFDYFSLCMHLSPASVHRIGLYYRGHFLSALCNRFFFFGGSEKNRNETVPLGEIIWRCDETAFVSIRIRSI